jgi:pimeloyl-ACP methyl ester carboxylesterase
MKRILIWLLRIPLILLALVVLVIAGWTIWQNQLANTSEVYTDHRADAPGAFAEIGDGLSLHYVTVGDIKADPSGAPLVFIHGYNQNGLSEWRKVADALAPGRASVLPDMLGFGFSARSTDPNRYSLKGQSDNLAAMLDQLGIAQVDLLGGSWGGAVAAQFALDHPTRVRRLVLFNAQIAGTGYDMIARSGALPLGVGRAISWFAIGGGQGGKGFFVSGCPDIDYCPTQAEIDARIRHTLIAGTTDAMYASSRAPTDPISKRVPQDLSQLRVPTLVMHAPDDQFIPYPEVEKTVATMPGSTRLITLNFPSHVPQLKVPAEVAAVLRDALP